MPLAETKKQASRLHPREATCARHPITQEPSCTAIHPQHPHEADQPPNQLPPAAPAVERRGQAASEAARTRTQPKAASDQTLALGMTVRSTIAAAVGEKKANLEGIQLADSPPPRPAVPGAPPAGAAPAAEGHGSDRCTDGLAAFLRQPSRRRPRPMLAPEQLDPPYHQVEPPLLQEGQAVHRG